MTRLELSTIIVSVVTFVAILSIGYVCGAFHKRSTLSQVFDFIAEKDLEKMMNKTGFGKIPVIYIQIFRLVFAASIATAIYFMFNKNIVYTAIAVFVGYKFIYLYMKFVEMNRIHQLNQQLPYAIRTVSYMCHLYPVTNAFYKSIEYVPEAFKHDFELLVKDIYNDPLSFQPYKNWIDRYEGKLKNLDVYLKILYRMQQSTSKEQDKLMMNLNSSIASETKRVRKQKNDSTNSNITWFGMLPVIYLGIILAVVMVIIVGNQL